MAKKVKSKPSSKPGYSMGYLIFHDLHTYIMRKYPKATVGDFNEAIAWEILEEDAATRMVHPGIDTEDLDETLKRVVMGRADQSKTNTLIRIAAIASAYLQQSKDVEEEKAKECECKCEKCDCNKGQVIQVENKTKTKRSKKVKKDDKGEVKDGGI